MKTWKKITLGLLIILIGGGIYLYIAGSGDETPDDDRQRPSSPIFPFSGDEEGDDFFDGQEDDNQTNEDDTDPVSQTPPQLWKITDNPVAGSGWVDGSIWYVRRDTGHIYSYNPQEREGERISNTTIPQVQKAVISPSGNHVIYRYLGDGDTLRTYVATLTEKGGDIPYQIDGEFIPNDTTDLTFSPDGNELFYIRSNHEVAAGIIRNLQTQQQETAFESSIREWRTGWNTQDGITLFTKPTRDSDGFAYLLDPVDGSLEKITEGAGLTVKISSDGKYILASSYANGEYKTQLKSINNSQSASLTTETLSDKCSWVDGEAVFFCGVPEDFPRNALKDWYQGTYAYTDQLTLFNADTESQDLLFDNSQLDKGPFDITNISVDDEFRYLQFINQRENTLWGYSL